MPHVRSAPLGIFAEVGSAAEPRRAARHLAPARAHALQRDAAPQRAARSPKRWMRSAATSTRATDKESTVFYAHVMDRHLPLAIDVLADMFRNARLDAAELRKERDVVLEEIKMYDDSPEDVINDRFARTLWRGANLGDPTIGFAETVRAIDRDDARRLAARALRAGQRAGRRRRQPRSRRAGRARRRGVRGLRGRRPPRSIPGDAGLRRRPSTCSTTTPSRPT